MDYSYDGSLKTLFCELCQVEFNYRDGYKHGCFNDVSTDQLQIVGKVLTKKSSCYEFTDEKVDDMEYLDEFRDEILTNLQKHPSTDTSKEKQLAPKKSSCVVKAMNNGREAPELLLFDAGSKDNCVDVDENRVAYNSDKNVIRLLEVIKDQPCLWNFKIPLAERSAYLVSAAWNKVASHFPGWNEAMVRSKFSLLKKSYSRKRQIPSSGSAAFRKKPWILEPYLAFLNDTLEPGSTISNVPSLTNITNCVEKEASTCSNKIKEMGFDVNTTFPESVGAKKRKKSLDPLEEAILKSIENRQSASVPPLSAIQQWGLWLGKTLEEIPDPTERLNLQAQITTLIAENIKHLVF